MKKFKHIVPFLLAMIMTLAIPLAGCNSCGDDKETATLQSIEINTDNVKKEYLYGETFTYDGLVVKASVLNQGAEAPEEKTLSASEYAVDSSSFIATAYGKYTITVSYTLGDVTKSQPYEVSVVPALQRIEIDTKNVKNRFFIGDKFNSDGLVVKAFIKKAGADNLEEKTLTSDEYTVDSNFNGRREGTYRVTVSYVYEETTRSAWYDVTVIGLLDRIELDLTDVQTKFYTDKQQTDDFTTEGLKANAFIWNKQTNQLEKKPLSYSDLEIDSSAYKKEIGFYDIAVSYTYENIKRTATYQVAHVASSDGLEVTLADGVEDTYTLSASVTEVEIDVSKIVVKGTERDGTVGAEINEYDVKLFRGSEEVALVDNKATVKAGAYNILVTCDSERTPDFVRSGFAIIYVNDDLVDFKLADGTFEQDSGLDKISETWSFTATYASGATRTITAEECVYELDTMTVVKDKALTITYTDYNAKGSAVTKTLDVNYTINRVYGKIEYTFDHSAIELTEDKKPLSQGDLKGVNAFLQLAGGTATYRSKTADPQASDCIEVKEKGLSVRFEGVGKITIGFASTSSKNESGAGLIDVGGNYIPATYEANNSIRVFDKNPNIYIVSGTIEQVFTFKITKPGVYTIVCPAKETGLNRGCRVYSIAMEDNVDDPTKIVCNVDFTDSDKFKTGTIAAASAAAPVAVKDISGNETGISVTKSTATFTPNRIVKVGGVNALQLQGAATKDENSVLFNVAQGQIKVTVKYFAEAGSYIDILDADGKVIASSSAKPTTGNSSDKIIEHTFTLDISADTTLYLGSHADNTINITYIKVEKA